ncbi:TSA1-like protein isoform X1 [Arabidopsis lyrata subsp. lyrata]|uniref:TSA1-like protein isoform X1 n=1 Tax=Arabidopsis lyrata subsp. lyrata TaxID=81972 RepID=UPI000A29AB1F|nr:TSA1-like protein isoform X1 [Arabidopsis lyrata subsp. lyrata]|eukprot:XP_020889490.1 TSA1-like protein isoform X1 [Arabidopsis lyrata subsp. lyrata]
MGTKFLALVLSLCLVLSSFYEVSCQDEGSGSLSTLDLIEHEYQTSVNSLQGNEVDQTETSGQKNSTSNNTISLSLSEEPVETVKESVDTSAELGAVTDEADKPSSMLDHIELEFEAHVNELKEAGSDGINKFDESKEDEEAARRHKMLEAIEREFEAAHAGFEQLKTDDSTQGLDDEQSAKRQSMLDEIERDFEAATKGLEQLKADDITGVNDEEHAAKRQKMLEEIEREFEEATKGLEELRHSTSSTDDEAHSAKRQSMLDEIEREFEAATSGLKELKINAFTIKDDVADKEQDAKRQSMLDAIEREFEAVTESFKQLEDIADNKDEGDDQSAKRQSMLDEIEREFEAATNSLKQLNLDDFTEGDDNEQSAKRHSMLEAIEREFEAATKGLEELKANDSTSDKDDDEHVARRKIMLEAIEREFEAATRGLEELKNESEHAENNRKSMLEAIEREFEAATNAKTNGEDSAKNPSTISTVQKTSGGYNAGLEGLLKPADGVCGCFNKDKDGLQADTDSSINIAEILAEESKLQGSGTSPLTTSLNNLVDTHRKETSSKVGSVLGSSSSVTSTTSESAATSESIESLKQTLRKLRGLSARDLVNHPNFDAIIAAGTRYEVLSSASIGYISLLAKYKTVIKEGLEASQRVQIAQTRAKLLKETAMEKQRTVDSVFAAAKTTAQRGDALHIRIVAIKKLLAKLEAEKVNVDSKFTSLTTNLSELLKEASQAYEEYHEAVHKAKDEQAAEEFAVETTKRAEHIWVEFLSSLN